MEYGEAINSEAAERALRTAVQLRRQGDENLHTIATRAVASTYCACVTDGEDAAEHRLSRIHSQLISEVERRLAKRRTEKENG